ncbi:MAG: OsmC family protein [Candidatus Krumholzibacteriota bacterium]|nr:OsmC family protein [Candidatus Krumholzibacteriota bacterium]
MDIITTFPGGKKVNAEYKGFTIKTDQAIQSGGDGSAPAPFDLFLTSLATCGGVYVVYFCEKRGIPMDNIRLIQKMERDPETHKLTKISLNVEIPPDFPEKYIKPLLNSVDLCAVKKTILDPPQFEINAITTG